LGKRRKEIKEGPGKEKGKRKERGEEGRTEIKKESK